MHRAPGPLIDARGQIRHIGQQSITAGNRAGITLAYYASSVYLDVGGNGTLTVSAGGESRLSPGLRAYSFTFG